MLDIAATEIGIVLTGKKKFKTVAEDFGKKTLRIQLVIGKLGSRNFWKKMPNKNWSTSNYKRYFFEQKSILDQQTIATFLLEILQTRA